MKFINNKSDMKIRIGDSNDCYWKTLRVGETIDLPKKVGKALELTEVTNSHPKSPKVTEGQIGNKKVETKQLENDFLKELIKIKGIGKKTAEDIVRIFPERKDLKNAIYNNEKIPLRDDVCELLKEKYGSS